MIDDDCAKSIACAVLKQAVIDCKCGTAKERYEAFRFLKSEDAEMYTALSGLDMSGKDIIKALSNRGIA